LEIFSLQADLRALGARGGFFCVFGKQWRNKKHVSKYEVRDYIDFTIPTLIKAAQSQSLLSSQSSA
jgi:hypothetical protein